MSDIPSDLFREILLRMPAETLFRLRAVCKAWRRTIDDPSFVKSHTINNQFSSNTFLIRNSNLHLISLESLNLINNGHQTVDAVRVKHLIRKGVARLQELPVAACNGLILITDFCGENTWTVWNPLTGDFRELPPLPDAGVDSGSRLSVCGKGVGYDCAADDYKVVRIDSKVEKVYRTHVYSLKRGFWTAVKDFPYCGLYTFQDGVFLNGALHWEARDFIICVWYSECRLLPAATASRRRHLGSEKTFGCVGRMLNS